MPRGAATGIEPNLVGLCRGAIALAVDELHFDEPRQQREQRKRRRPRKGDEAPRRKPPRRSARRDCAAVIAAAPSKRRATSIATTMTTTLSAALQRALRGNACAPSPGGYPPSAITIQKSSARTSVATIVIADDERNRIGKEPAREHAGQQRAQARRDRPRGAGLRRERVLAESGDQAVERGAARVDANRVPHDDDQDEARNDVADREIVHDRRLRERSPPPATPPRRTTPARRTARRAAYCGDDDNAIESAEIDGRLAARRSDRASRRRARSPSPSRSERRNETSVPRRSRRRRRRATARPAECTRRRRCRDFRARFPTSDRAARLPGMRLV